MKSRNRLPFFWTPKWLGINIRVPIEVVGLQHAHVCLQCTNHNLHIYDHTCVKYICRCIYIYIYIFIYLWRWRERYTNKGAYTDRSSTYSTKEIPTATPGRVFKAVLRSRSSVSNVSEVLRIPRWCDGMAWWVRTPNVGGIAYRESPGRKMVANVCALLVWGPPPKQFEDTL